jgi:hypothetical protein
MGPAEDTHTELAARLRSEVFGWLVAACFCGFGGFIYFAGIANKGNTIDTAFVWTLRLGAPAFGVCIVLAVAGLRAALVAHVLACGVLAPVLIVTSVAWFVEQVYVQGFAIGMLGLLAGGAMIRSWRELECRREVPPDGKPGGKSTIAITQNDNKGPPLPELQMVSDQVPTAVSDIPPEGGYLGELGRQKD